MSISNAELEVRERRRERRRSFLIFFSIVLAVYGSINYYLCVRLEQCIPSDSWFHFVFLPLFLLVAISTLVGQYLETTHSSLLSDSLTWIGSFWLGIMSWYFLAAVLIDLVRLLDYGLGFLPAAWYVHAAETKEWVAGIASVVIFASMILGFINARRTRVRPLTISIDKAGTPMKIAAISDMHMGTLVGRGMVRQFVAKINALKPDLVLMIGDQVDGNVHPVMQLDLGSELKKIESKYGVYAITGNHEYIGNVETACAYLEAHGIRMLRDECADVAGIYLVGREDRAAKQFAHYERKPLAELVEPLDKSKPIILMDHTPFHLEEAEQHGIDLQLSGHTHHAQIWPFNFITKAVYEVSWGYKRKGATHVYVSCGSGTWGPPIRIGNRPEIMAITMEFSSKQMSE
ncbi:MAG: metallophosphoesterase [Bacteroidota bacterium]|nr:metallophosphoesterase [Bacteroidota bacterium]MDP4234313.1 metallophosphoesterase [Bacteroidota bacterium]MDP4243247.1 metallophosphoesterase [Bacteroidota bacterium]MDP4288046.1 metallophosphoesterase [Bacteroidota bacterium]